MMSAKFIIVFVSLYLVVTLPSSLPCEEPDGMAYPRGSEGVWNVLCPFRLCKAYLGKPGQTIPGFYYKANLSNKYACNKIGGICQAVWSSVSFLQFNATDSYQWNWNSTRVTVAYACKAKISGLTKRDTRLTRFSGMKSLVQRNATCWKEKMHQLLSTGKVECSNSGEGPEKCCISTQNDFE
ncbi:uncharacterized protein LOC134196344 [Corticium candelabrum]|uniref:uncharacterized protein LOC134196344 n=1 Tax=Corticium candelabrum TaxID=121492 RepID=UPI002E2609F4|nr:uncharacterized protein LOC134196344 [Corticium candelabrum]